MIPIISCLTKTFGSLHVSQNVSIDEMLLETKCRVSFTQYQENILQLGMMFEEDVLQLRAIMWTKRQTIIVKSVRNICVKCVLKSTTLGPMYKYMSILPVVIASVYKNNLFCFICIQYYTFLGMMSVIKVI